MQGNQEALIARDFGVTTTQFRADKALIRKEQLNLQISQAKELKKKGYTNAAIGYFLRLSESQVRTRLKK